MNKKEKTQKQMLKHLTRLEAAEVPFSEDGIPILPAVINGVHLWVWCPKCNASHFHGRAKHVVGNRTHRSPHCYNKAHWPSGYYLMVEKELL